MEFVPATPADISAVEGLLASVGLSPDGFSKHIDHAVVARDGSRIIGCAALELYGIDALQ